jgi:diamine N-acetyltransferase
MRISRTAAAKATRTIPRVPDQDFVVTGERAALGLLRREHIPQLTVWFNDPEVRRGLAHRGLPNEDGELRWYEEITAAAAAARPETVPFSIHDAADGELVGVCSLGEIDHNFLRAGFGIYLGQRRGSGIGSDATRLVLDWAFTILGLRNVLLETYEFNESAVRAYERAGFQVIGRRRDAVLALGRRWDVILMDATPEGFESPSLGRLLP